MGVLVVLASIMVNAIGSVFVSDVAGSMYGVTVSPVQVFCGVIAATGIVGVVKFYVKNPNQLSNSNYAFAGTFQDVWVSWMLKGFYSEFPFLSEMRDLSSYVKNDIINVREIGADPEVYINNTTYPIPTIERDDTNYAISLDKYETVNTAINLKESERLDYNKFMTATEQHRARLLEKAQEKWTHALGAAGNASLTPVISCSGTDRGNGTKKMTAQDLVTYQNTLDQLKVPSKGRILCLSGEHRADLVAEDIARFKELSDLKEGEFKNHFGFKIFSSIHTPKYHKSALTKQAFGAAADSNTATASIFWHKDEVGYAKGSMTMHFLPKEMNTGFRRDEVGFSMFGIGLPLRNKYIGAIVSGATS